VLRGLLHRVKPTKPSAARHKTQYARNILQADPSAKPSS
jgi:hypothetical protein